MSVTSVKTAIVNKLEAMQSLKAVFGYESSNPDGKYPFATITLREGSSEFASTARNRRDRYYTIHLYQEQMAEQGQGSENAEAIVANVIDEMEQAFDMDTTLSGACIFAQPINWVAEYEDREHDVRLLTIIVNAVELTTAQ